MERILTENQYDEIEDNLEDAKYFVEDLQQKMEDQCSGGDDRTGELDSMIKKLKKVSAASPEAEADLKPVIETLEQLSMEIMDCGTFQDLMMMETSDWFKFEE
tara:strand:- start:42214 stop:42522 length:309 start_codon:yes stop_codon:yes gene_type:complete